VARDSEQWKRAYEAYKKVYPDPVVRRKPKNIPKTKVTYIFNPKSPEAKAKWLTTHREMLRWQKTEDFAKWRKKQFLKQGGTCWYCDEPLPGVRQNVEHIIPKIRGGDNRKSNLVLACWRCNKSKGTNLTSYKKRAILKEKNKKKKGTYQRNYGHLRSEEYFGYELGQMLRED